MDVSISDRLKETPMANTRIKDLTTTATSAASDDYLALDGATNGTRKILASDIGGGTTLYIEVNGNQYEVTGFEKATVSGVTGMILYYDDGNNGSIFFADGPAMADVESTIIAQIPTATSDLTNDSGFVESSDLATVATSGAYSDLSGTPSLATVATSGSYNDLSNKPTIPSISGLQTQAITDTGGYFSTDTVEAALQQLGATVDGVETLLAAI